MGRTMGEAIPNLKSVDEFDKCMTCLAVQLPAAVWDDVKHKWEAVKSEVKERQVVEHLNNTYTNKTPTYERPYNPLGVENQVQ